MSMSKTFPCRLALRDAVCISPTLGRPGLRIHTTRGSEHLPAILLNPPSARELAHSILAIVGEECPPKPAPSEALKEQLWPLDRRLSGHEVQVGDTVEAVESESGVEAGVRYGVVRSGPGNLLSVLERASEGACAPANRGVIRQAFAGRFKKVIRVPANVVSGYEVLNAEMPEMKSYGFINYVDGRVVTHTPHDRLIEAKDAAERLAGHTDAPIYTARVLGKTQAQTVQETVTRRKVVNDLPGTKKPKPEAF